MKAAGMKSNTDIGFRQDSVEFLDNNRAKTNISRPNVYDLSRQNSSQSGRINETRYSSNRSAFGEYPDLVNEKSKYELDKYSTITPGGRPSSVNSDIRGVYKYNKKPEEIFEFDARKYKWVYTTNWFIGKWRINLKTIQNHSRINITNI
jgi:hypothetical protein